MRMQRSIGRHPSLSDSFDVGLPPANSALPPHIGALFELRQKIWSRRLAASHRPPESATSSRKRRLLRTKRSRQRSNPEKSSALGWFSKRVILAWRRNIEPLVHISMLSGN